MGAPPAPRAARSVELVTGSAAEIAARLRPMLRDAGGDVVIAAGRGAGTDLDPYRRLAERYGGRFAVTRPQVEAGRATRRSWWGRRPRRSLRPCTWAWAWAARLPHVLGMAESARVIAVNLDPAAPIFEHADLGAVADAGEVGAGIGAGVSGAVVVLGGGSTGEAFAGALRGFEPDTDDHA